MPKNIDSQNNIQVLNNDNYSLSKDLQIQKSCFNNISQSQETKMDIELGASNHLNGSVSTQASNNIKSSMESKNMNISETNIIFLPKKNNHNEIQIQNQNEILLQPQNQIQIANLSKNLKEEKEKEEFFKFNFKSSEESIRFTGEYLNEIYTNLIQEEEELLYKPKIGYMNMQNDINEQMRAILIDWLIEVHYRFRLKSETLFQTVWIIDTYLSLFPIIRAKLQLLGIASLLISCKSQEIYYPQLNELIDITDGAYVKDELIEMESHVLKVLKFNIISPTSNDFYNIIAKAFNFDDKQYYLGKYFLESSLIDYQMIKHSSSVIAVSCAYIVMKFFGIHNYKCLYSNKVIKENCPQKIIKETARELCYLVKNLSESTLRAVKDKYSLPQFLNVAQYVEQK